MALQVLSQCDTQRALRRGMPGLRRRLARTKLVRAEPQDDLCAPSYNGCITTSGACLQAARPRGRRIERQPRANIANLSGNIMMLDPKQLDELTRQVVGSLPKGLQALHEDMTKSLRVGLEAGLAKLDLVTRAEFDIQAAVLARTRAKLTELEARVAELERVGAGSEES